jgi:pimeloyl-ACP methyl ester carboxylesterase
MLMFRGPDAEKNLSANNYSRLVEIVLGEALKKGHMTDEDRKAYIEAWSQPGALTGGLNYYRAARIGPPAPDEVPKAITPVNPAAFMVKVPTLVIWGEKDRALLTGNLEGLDAYVPDLTIERIPDGSHWVIHEEPAQINALIHNFLKR